jgi:hypothetical protein
VGRNARALLRELFRAKKEEEDQDKRRLVLARLVDTKRINTTEQT